jgi:hypothetical protein
MNKHEDQDLICAKWKEDYSPTADKVVAVLSKGHDDNIHAMIVTLTMVLLDLVECNYTDGDTARAALYNAQNFHIMAATYREGGTA